MHVLAARTTALDVSQCLDTNAHKQSQSSQQKPASSQQSRTCWTFARPVPQYAVTVIYRNQQHKKQKSFSVFRKKRAKPKKKNNDDFQKVVIYNKMHEIKIIFCFPEKSKAKKQNNDDFRKVVISGKNARKK